MARVLAESFNSIRDSRHPNGLSLQRRARRRCARGQA
jgi:hypothetical protein